MTQTNKILIVDDDLVSLTMMKMSLQDKYSIATANSGEAALDVLTSFHPDIILLDITMPGINGLDLCRRIRKDSRNGLVKIILVSARDGVEERLKGYEVGADDYITKPFVDRELEAKIRVFLRLKRVEEVDRLKSDLMELFAHETRTPLNGILAVTSFFKSEQKLENKQQEMIEIIENCGRQLFEFVQKTDLLCNLKNGLELERSKNSLLAGLDSVIVRKSKYARERRVSIILDDFQEDFQLNVDWKLLIASMEYILENSVKYSHVGGEVKILAKDEEGILNISFIDGGEGIQPDWVEKIFDEFAIKDINHHQKGQGLSLAISKYIMELHDGTIEVESQVGKGSVFTLQLPMA